MFYNLELQNLVTVGAINQRAFTLVPLETGKTSQKFIVGDDSTSIQAFEQKKGSISRVYISEKCNKDITRVIHSGGGGKYNIFASSGQTIRGINKKGKEFFRFDTNHTETIKNLSVIGTELWSSGDFVLQNYQSTGEGIKDKFYYVSEDKMNDLMVANVTGDLINNSILACEDGSVRVLGQSNDVIYAHKLDSAPMCVSKFESSRPTTHILYGTKRGNFGLLNMQREQAVPIWDI